MVSPSEIIDAALIAYVILGSTSGGYILFRIGWPNIRSLGMDYKSGWALIFGGIFSAIIVAVSLLPIILGMTEMVFFEALMLGTIAVISAAVLLFTLKRKFLGKKKTTVAVPKRVIAANIAARKAVEKIPAKRPAAIPKEPAKKAPAEAKTAGEGAQGKEAKRGFFFGRAREKKAPVSLKKEAQKEPVEKAAIKLFPEKTAEKKPVEKPAEKPEEKKKWVFFPKKIEQPGEVKEPAKVESISKPLNKPLFGFGIGKKPSMEARTKSAEEIIKMLEQKRANDSTRFVISEEELDRKIEKSQRYIRQNIREKIGGELAEENERREKESREEEKSKIEESLPKSAKLLKELLNESNGGENGGR